MNIYLYKIKTLEGYYYTIDDEEANVRSLIRLFEKEYNVYSAFNGREALNLVEKKMSIINKYY